MGFPQELWDSKFGDGPKVIFPTGDPYRVNTELCAELELITEFAGGSIEDWNRRTWAERRMWVYFRMLQNEKENRQDERLKAEAEANRKQAATWPKVEVDRPGIRS